MTEDVTARRWHVRALRFLLLSVGMYAITLIAVVLWLNSGIPIWIDGELCGEGHEALAVVLSGLYTLAWFTGPTFHRFSVPQGSTLQFLLDVGYQSLTVVAITGAATKIGNLSRKPKLVFALVYFFLFCLVAFVTAWFSGPLFSPGGSNVRY